MKFVYAVIFVLLTATRIQAQPTIFDPSHVKWDNVKAAQTLSNIGVGTGIGLDVIDVFRSDDKKHAGLVLAERYAIVAVTAEVIKRVVHRERPDHSDRKSFLSEHTAFAGRIYIAIPVAYLRMAGDKHYLTDTVGGFVLRKAVDHFIK